MQGKNNNPYRPPFYNAPVNLADPLLQQITMMALLSRPGIERQLEDAINIIEGINNTIRTMRRGMESFHTSMREAQMHMLSLPTKQAYGPSKKDNVKQQPHNSANVNNQPQYNKLNTNPLSDSNINSTNNNNY